MNLNVVDGDNYIDDNDALTMDNDDDDDDDS